MGKRSLYDLVAPVAWGFWKDDVRLFGTHPPSDHANSSCNGTCQFAVQTSRRPLSRSLPARSSTTISTASTPVTFSSMSKDPFRISGRGIERAYVKCLSTNGMEAKGETGYKKGLVPTGYIRDKNLSKCLSAFLRARYGAKANSWSGGSIRWEGGSDILKNSEPCASSEDSTARSEKVVHLCLLTNPQVVLDSGCVSKNMYHRVRRSKLSEQPLHPALHPRAHDDTASAAPVENATQGPQPVASGTPPIRSTSCSLYWRGRWRAGKQPPYR